ncbi:protein RALF-like 32 [Prosopis cineraria]|uniref:protein RALF-like 32 n=1 Tax=Prosopis cineraria TaxID=364024 RepID=UPI0024101C24|nr:protein RALF-like 32 [Prosopis cineraria]
MESKAGVRVSSSTFFLFCFYSMILLFGFISSLCLKSDAAAVSAAPFSCKNGTIAECNEDDEMMMMESEISQRLMAEKTKYISTGALRKNRPVCKGGGSGKSGECLPPPSNPYTRGCSKEHRCRSDS